MTIGVNKKILTGFIVCLLVIFSLGIAAYVYVKKGIESSRWTQHAQEVTIYAERVRSTIAQIENQRLKYLLSGDRAFSQWQLREVGNLKGYIKKLDSLTDDNPRQQKHIIQLEQVAEKLVWLPDSAVENVYQSVNGPYRIAGVDSYGDMVAHVIDQIQDEETRLKTERAAAARGRFYNFTFLFAGLQAAGLFILIFLTYSFNASLNAQLQAERKLKHAADAINYLYENAPCGYFSLNEKGVITAINRTLLDWLLYTREEVTGRMKISNVLANCSAPFFEDDFETLKAEKTINDIECTMTRKDQTSVNVILNASIVEDTNHHFSVRCSLFDNMKRKSAEEEIRQLNHELEGFAYSVSHDLRAPLRSINGYSQILKDDYAHNLDEEGKRVIDVIVRNTKKMGQLIDDLLNFSRTGRKEIVKVKVKMADYVIPILNDLVSAEKGRDIKTEVGELGSSMIDVNLMSQVWINLISNAIKYTRKKPVALIEIGSWEHADEIVYYVKDNGVGFDMHYSDKLFGVFQRLHKAEDFEGTGVGLALVKKIIDRHHGRIWAEARENAGATFYFSLPKVQ